MLTLFLLCTVLLPYGIYALTARLLHWTDRRDKSPVQHTDTVTSTLILCTTLYFVGGYSESYYPLIEAPITLATTLGYGALSEIPALRTSLRHIRSWTWIMWLVTVLTAFLVLVFAVFHVRFAVMRYGPVTAYGAYVASFVLLPGFSALLVYGVYGLDKSRPEKADLGVDDFELVVGDGEEETLMRSSHAIGRNSSDSEGEPDSEATTATAPESGEEAELRTLPPRPIRRVGPVRIRKVLRVHLHHYQIFAYLAAFTRFPTLWSRCAAGLALGCMMHGIAAYGMDSIFEYEEEKA